MVGRGGGAGSSVYVIPSPNHRALGNKAEYGHADLRTAFFSPALLSFGRRASRDNAADCEMRQKPAADKRTVKWDTAFISEMVLKLL